MSKDRDIIISDTSSLIALSKINKVKILSKIFGTIFITPEVKNEFQNEIPNWIKIKSFSNYNLFKFLTYNLDEGEASVITLALENNQSLLIIDEKKGRKIAKSMGLKIIGVLGVLVIAKEKGYLKEIKSTLEKLEKLDFRISESLKTHILKKVKEL